MTPFTDAELKEWVARESAAYQDLAAREKAEEKRRGETHTFSRIEPMANVTADPNSKYKEEFKTGSYRMTEEQFVSLRRAEDGLEEFLPQVLPTTPAVTVAAMNPLAADL